MTQKEKDLLLKELCAILPYKTLLDIDGEKVYLVKIDLKSTTPFIVGEYCNSLGSLNTFAIEQVKPYLRPMSSMTEEEFHDIIIIDNKRGIFSSRHLTLHLDGEVVDYLNSKMFDWRNLISKGLAMEAPEGMYH